MKSWQLTCEWEEKEEGCLFQLRWITGLVWTWCSSENTLKLPSVSTSHCLRDNCWDLKSVTKQPLKIISFLFYLLSSKVNSVAKDDMPGAERNNVFISNLLLLLKCNLKLQAEMVCIWFFKATVQNLWLFFYIIILVANL